TAYRAAGCAPAAARPSKRRVSRPLRLTRRTRSPSLYASIRQTVDLLLVDPAVPVEGLGDWVGCIGPYRRVFTMRRRWHLGCWRILGRWRGRRRRARGTKLGSNLGGVPVMKTRT